MQYIKKGDPPKFAEACLAKMHHKFKGDPPRNHLAYAKLPGATYADYPCPADWNATLLQEQGHLCAYTLQRITADQMKREHLQPQNGDPNNDLNHQNVVGVCRGNEGLPPAEQYADTRKGNRELDRRLWPTHPKCEQHLGYRPDGRVRIADPVLAAQAIDGPGGHLSLLNLNHPLLVSKRRESFAAVERQLQRNDSPAKIKQLLERYRTRDAQGRLMEQNRFVLYRLEKILRKKVR